ncbi:hypothetical protein [Gulosibacter sediminis]|nr:hypothetical protein [Gulosibacter sediminis]
MTPLHPHGNGLGGHVDDGEAGVPQRGRDLVGDARVGTRDAE